MIALLVYRNKMFYLLKNNILKNEEELRGKCFLSGARGPHVGVGPWPMPIMPLGLSGLGDTPFS